MDAPLPQIVVSVQADLPDCAAEIPSLDWLVSVVRYGLAQVLASDVAGQVSLLLTDDATVRELNREYRGLDETTDVLSFSAEHAGHWQGDEPAPSPGPSPIEGEQGMDAVFPIPDGEPPPLGDIVISIPEAVRQAGEQETSLRRELALLIVHGALHLLGHDHYADVEGAEMQRLEQAALAAIFGEREGQKC